MEFSGFDVAALGPGEISLLAVAAVCAVYFWYVNRPRQRYVLDRTYEAPLSAVWSFHDMRPGNLDWVPQLVSSEWVDEAARDMRLVYATGAELRQRIVVFEPERHLVAEARVRKSPDGPYGDHMRSSAWLTPLEDGRTHLKGVLEIERESGWGGVATRLSYPFLMRYAERLMIKRLVARGEMAERVPHRGASALWRVALVLSTLIWLMWLTSFWAGLGALVMLVTHEYGHVWSMRRNGHETARFYLVPLFGGIAIGSRVFRTEAEAVEIFLMGPVFGLVPGLLSFAVFGLTGDPFFVSLAAFLTIVNGVNLAPLPPLDGGRVTQSLLRPLGDKAWYAGSGLLVLAGAAVAGWLRLPGLLFVAALGLLVWGTTRAPNPATAPLSRRGWAVAFIAYAGLIAAHLAVAWWAFELSAFDALDLGPAIFLGADET